jgi:chromosome segregation ATPase
MTDNPSELRELLKGAELEISQLRSDSEEYVTAISDLADGQTALEMQIILLNSKIQDMEDVLENAAGEYSEAQTLIHNLRNSLVSLRETTTVALAQAKQSSTRVQLAASLYTVASKAQLSDEIGILDEAERHMAQLREKAKHR